MADVKEWDGDPIGRLLEHLNVRRKCILLYVRRGHIPPLSGPWRELKPSFFKFSSNIIKISRGG